MATRSEGIWSFKGNTASTPYTRVKGVYWVGILYMVLYAQRASPNLSCQSCFDFATTLLSNLQSVLLKASANPLVGALYIEDLRWANLNFSQMVVTSLLTNGLPLSVIIYRGMPYR